MSTSDTMVKATLGIGIAICLFFLVDTCKNNATLLASAKEYHAYKDTVKFYKDKNNTAVAYNEALLLEGSTLKDMNAKLSEKLKDLKIKNASSVTEINTIATIDTFVITHTRDLPCDTFVLPFKIDSTHFSLSGILTNEFIDIHKIEIPNKQSVVVGYKKNGLFTPKSYVVTVQNTNPIVITTGLTNYTIKPKKRFYEKGYFKYGVGVMTGLMLSRASSR